MSQSNGPSFCGRGAAAITAALALAAPALAQAQQPESSAPAPMPGLYRASGATRYSTPDGAVRFVLDRSGGRAALVRFEGDPEVHVLRPVMAAGGGEIYRTEDGDVILRVTPGGGITVYTRLHRDGSPASEEAQVPPLTPEAVQEAYMRERLRQLQIAAA